MAPRSLARLLPAITITAAMLLLAGCSDTQPPASDAETAAPVVDPTEQPNSPDETDTDANSDDEPAPDATEQRDCESLVTAGTVTALTDAGWSVVQKEFRILGKPVKDGIECMWGNYDVPSDHVQVYGWAPMSASEARDHQEGLRAAGWQREEDPRGIILTADPNYSMSVDEDGYGMTYLFRDNDVIFADTRQGLLLIQTP
ncbi:hypothetical protein [Microbacterium sp. YY-01]|uniref:hypothetical protein n=1 Tax=Microbacterium sp. YY-01 TaxID=3421634 RepID=UPI003D1774CA